MKKEEILREDGRYLIYYWFDEEPDLTCNSDRDDKSLVSGVSIPSNKQDPDS